MGRALDDQGREQVGEDNEDAPPFSVFQLDYLRKKFPAPEMIVPTTQDELVLLGTGYAKRMGQLSVLAHIASLIRGAPKDTQ